MKKSTLIFCSVFLLTLFLVSGNTKLRAESKFYYGISVGDMDNRESSSDRHQTWSHFSLDGRLGANIYPFLDLEVRYGKSNRVNEDLKGSTVETQFNHFYGGYSKLKLPDRSMQPYALIGYTEGELERCPTNCNTIDWDGASFGVGVNFKLDSKFFDVFFVETISYSEENNGGIDKEYTGWNGGLNASF